MEIWRYIYIYHHMLYSIWCTPLYSCLFSHTVAVTAADSDMKKVGNTFLQLKLVLNKGVGTEEVFMGKFLVISIARIMIRPTMYTCANQSCRVESTSVLFVPS